MICTTSGGFKIAKRPSATMGWNCNGGCPMTGGSISNQALSVDTTFTNASPYTTGLTHANFVIAPASSPVTSCQML